MGEVVGWVGGRGRNEREVWIGHARGLAPTREVGRGKRDALSRGTGWGLRGDSEGTSGRTPAMGEMSGGGRRFRVRAPAAVLGPHGEGGDAGDNGAGVGCRWWP